MRITQKIIFDDFMRDINKNRSQMAVLQSDLSSGRRVRIPSQDPVAFQRSRILEENIRKQEQYQKNIANGLRQARLAQESLDEIINNLVEVKALLTSAASDTTSESARISMANELDGISNNVISALNSSYGDRYLFAGTRSSEAPFRSDPGAVGNVADTSNNTAPQIQAGDHLQITISISGEELRESRAGDLFEILADMRQAMADNDTAKLRESMPKLDQLIDHVSILTAQLGGNINRMEFMYDQYESSGIVLKSNVSELVDTDYAQAFSDMQRTQVAYEAAMAVHTRMIHNTLLDYL